MALLKAVGPFCLTKYHVFKIELLVGKKVIELSYLLTKNAFAENKLKLIKMTKYVNDSIENIEGKRENARYHHFLTFPHCFQKLPLSEWLNVGIV